MPSPVDDDKIYEAHTFARNGPQGLQTILQFLEVLEPSLELMAALAPRKAIFRGRGMVTAKVPAMMGQPEQEVPQVVEFGIEARNLQEAYASFEAGLAQAQQEFQEDVDQQLAARKLRAAGSKGGILKPD